MSSHAKVKVLVTGGAGFVGTAIVQALSRTHPEWKITVVDIKPVGQWKSPDPAIEYIQADIRKLEEASNAVEWAEPDVIVHTAGMVPGGKARYNRRLQDIHNVTKLNVGGTEHMLEAARDSGVSAFVFSSSCTVITDDLDTEYPNMTEDIPIPTTSLIYGESKAKAERLVLDSNSKEMATCALRPSVIFGPDDYQLIPSIHACIAKGETRFLIGSGDNLYDFTHVENVADAHVLAVENLLSTKTAAGQAIFISNNQPITFRDFCLAVWAVFDHIPSYSVRIPSQIGWAIGLASECVSWFTGSHTTLCRGSVKDAVGTRYASSKKSREILKYEPRIHLADGIRSSCEAYKERLQQRGKATVKVKEKVDRLANGGSHK